MGLYFLSSLIVVFFNAALVRAALLILRGEPATVGGSLRFALSRLSAIAGYAFFTATVGLLITWLEHTSESLAQCVRAPL